MVRTWVVVASLLLSFPAVADPWDGKTPRAAKQQANKLLLDIAAKQR